MTNSPVAQSVFTGETFKELNMVDKSDIDMLCDAINQDLSSERVRYFYAHLLGENNLPEGSEEVDAWIADQAPLVLPIWVSKK